MRTHTTDTGPRTELDPDYSSPGAAPVPWATARTQLDTAGTFLLCTVRPDGRPHVTTLIAVWLDEALWFCTGPQERKARNLAANPHCVLATGDNRLDEGLDVVVEGQAVRERDRATLLRVAEAYVARYGQTWRFEVLDDAFSHGGGPAAHVFRVAPRTAFGFAKGEPFGQTRWRFTLP